MQTLKKGFKKDKEYSSVGSVTVNRAIIAPTL